MAPTTRVSNRDKHPGYILRPDAYLTKQEMDDDDEWEGEGATCPPAPSNVKATSPSGTYARNQLINAKQGQNAAVENRETHKYKHMLKRQSTLQELVADTNKQVRLDIEEDKNEENTEIAQHRKRKQRVVYSASTDDESAFCQTSAFRSTSKKLKHDECISQPIGRVEVLLPNWRTIVARDVAKLHLNQTESSSHKSHPKEKKGLEPVQANNVDYGGHEDEDEVVEEDEEEKSNLVGRNGSQHAPSEISQRVPTYDLRRASRESTPLAYTQRRVTDKLPQASEFQARVPAPSAQQPAKKTHPRFRVEDLPDGSQQRFRENLSPLWLDFVSTLENPWDLTNHIDVMQEIWNMTFTDIDHTVQKTNDAVYFLLIQRANTYRHDFAKRGEIAVAAYLHSIGLRNPNEIAQHISFLVPSVSETARCYPFMWQEAKNIMNEDGHIERTETKGAFCSRPISDTLALYLEIRESIPQALRQTDNPRGALVLATASVERALRMYSTGVCIKPKDRLGSRFSRKHWGVMTEEVMISAKKTTSRGWKKIIKAAIPYIKARRAHHGTRVAPEKEREGPNGYTHCVDVDSGSDSGSDVNF